MSEPTQVLVENSQSCSTGGDATYTINLPTDGQLYTFADPNSSEQRLMDMSNLWATDISHNNSNYVISISGGSDGKAVGGIEAGGPVPVFNGQVADIATWSIMANYKG